MNITHKDELNSQLNISVILFYMYEIVITIRIILVKYMIILTYANTL